MTRKTTRGHIRISDEMYERLHPVCTCILGNAPLEVTTSVMCCAVHRDSEVGQAEQDIVREYEP